MSKERENEQRYIEDLYDRLDVLRAQTRQRLSEVRREGPSGSPQNRSERDAFATLYEDRLQQLENVEDRLAFGRLDMDDRQRRYVGRIGLQDQERHQLLTDWRAPAAEPFYQATAAHPQGVIRRRHLMTQGRNITGIEDDVLDLDKLGDVDKENLSGEGALMAALTSHRTGKMSDIVATIQAEQDTIIRSPLAGALVVQGGPGTGKTAVALHRIAYLLYSHRRRLEHSGVLIIGPSRAFLRYIDKVLPSLGETGVLATTIADLLPNLTADGKEEDRVAEIKGRAMMARVVQRAVRQRQRVPHEPQVLKITRGRITLDPKHVQEGIERARRSRKPHNEARAVFVQHLLSVLASQLAASLNWEATFDDLNELAEELRQEREVRIALNLCWMPVSAEKVIQTLWANPQRLAQAAPRLSTTDRELLYREETAAFTAADIPLLDEAAELLGDDDQARRKEEQQAVAQKQRDLEFAQEVLDTTGAHEMVSADLLAQRFGHHATRATAAEAAAKDRTWTFGHVVVDEAQELSPMAWRSLTRRCPSRSFTIVGDTAQTAASAGTRDWNNRLDRLFSPNLRVEELTVNYRTPGRIMDAATSAVRANGLSVTPPLTAREGKHPVTYRHSVDLAAGVIEEITAQQHIVGDGRLAVICAHEHLQTVWNGVSTSQTMQQETDIDNRQNLNARTVVITPEEAKGLEFDVVILVDPALIAKDPIAGPGNLYVAMSRPTQSLAVLYQHHLPAGLPPQTPEN